MLATNAPILPAWDILRGTVVLRPDIVRIETGETMTILPITRATVS